ncbi:Arc family DNA-binding protein [Xenorhabdus griffiniae]|uniref:Arc family DNA-binding protein n=1 Tax=Xenorhabdus griffiniae TaxID=351672 RepID=A0ABY9XEB6_9GAMM|nr:Arc family DNA-binding protein [Xenorhabdus griffiniae]MBD1228389.1 Arc family DNA-binding protein [Xenorhabdus griffiniae]MBE8587958.1 Arc family DNA-binding protein [Xenorhabdus griffiniae]WMV71229.1 Arc family DNA-binding protein [Xenorhabdus griffiniae]WNH00905.1 Arc family DNA-binding protein [Xenorhabdus griffiniae]
MSREDPQLRIRLPIELKEKIEETAKANSRSMNAEIVQRLDVSFLNEPAADELISAKDAIHIISNAKDELSKVIFKRTVAEINRGIRIGHKIFSIDLDNLDLEGLSESDFVSVFQKTFNELERLGYVVPDNAWDVSGFLVKIPGTD